MKFYLSTAIPLPNNRLLCVSYGIAYSRIFTVLDMNTWELTGLFDEDEERKFVTCSVTRPNEALFTSIVQDVNTREVSDQLWIMDLAALRIVELFLYKRELKPLLYRGIVCPRHITSSSILRNGKVILNFDDTSFVLLDFSDEGVSVHKEFDGKFIGELERGTFLFYKEHKAFVLDSKLRAMFEIENVSSVDIVSDKEFLIVDKEGNVKIYA